MSNPAKCTSFLLVFLLNIAKGFSFTVINMNLNFSSFYWHLHLCTDFIVINYSLRFLWSLVKTFQSVKRSRKYFLRKFLPSSGLPFSFFFCTLIHQHAITFKLIQIIISCDDDWLYVSWLTFFILRDFSLTFLLWAVMRNEIESLMVGKVGKIFFWDVNFYSSFQNISNCAAFKYFSRKNIFLPTLKFFVKPPSFFLCLQNLFIFSACWSKSTDNVRKFKFFWHSWWRLARLNLRFIGFSYRV